MQQGKRATDLSLAEVWNSRDILENQSIWWVPLEDTLDTPAATYWRRHLLQAKEHLFL